VTNGELLALIDTYASQSFGGDKGVLANERALAIARYNSEPYGNEVDGRSQLVSSEIRDTVETVVPQLMRIFLSGDAICEFDPETPQDVPQAKQESDYVNFIVTQRNRAYQVFGTWFRDALLCKNGYAKAFWEEKSDVLVEDYKGLPDDMLQMLAQDEDVQIVAHDAYPAANMPQAQALPQAMGQAGLIQPPVPQLHDVKVRRTKKKGFVRFDNVPCEEIRVHSSTRDLSLQDALYVEHRVNLTLSEIRQMGYEVADDEAGILEDLGTDIEPVARDRFNEIQNILNQNSSDPAAARATFREVWMRVDEDGDGIAELRKLCLVNRLIKSDEETDLIPFACITPVIQPHRHVGYGYYDFLKDIEAARTAMLRAYFDNIYLANNGRYGVNVKNVNVDDLLISRPGGVVRVDGPPGENIFPITHPTVGDTAMNAMNYLDGWKKNATGVVIDSQALSADVLNNSTASGISQAISVWQARVEGVARCFAETGMTDLFRIVHALTLKNMNQPEMVQLTGNWISIDPREWVKRTSLTVTVGLGTGSKEAKMAFLQQQFSAQMQGMQFGIAKPQNIYETALELTKEMGYKDGARFWTNPAQEPPQPPQPNPIVQAEQIKAQAHLQGAQAKAQTDMQLGQQKAQNDMQQASQEAQQKMALERWQAELEAQTKLAIANIEIAAKERMAQFQVLHQPNPVDGKNLGAQ
jgi:hypothetical protein